MSVMAVESLQGWATERLECEITLVAAHLAAGECRWLELVAEFDRREAWRDWGCHSTAHWLNWRCGLALGAGRERVRTARRLSELPTVRAAFATGELSYSKVRAITRVATTVNESSLVELALSMTASHVENTLRHYKQATTNTTGDESDDDRGGPVAQYRDRFLSTHWNDDGTLSITAKLPPAEGSLVLAALRRAADALYRDCHRRRHDATATHPDAEPGDVPAETSNPEPGDVPAETSNPEPGDVPAETSNPEPGDVPAETSEAESGSAWSAGDDDVPAGTFDEPGEAFESPTPDDRWSARQADALVALAETVVTDGLRPGSGPNRHHMVIHLHTDTTDNPAAYLQDGPVLTNDTARRLMCDASVSFALHGPDGKVTNHSPYAPTIPTAIARAVKLRDQNCVFPGCTRHAYIDLHHIHHRADNGENSLTNLCVLCRAHHRMIHEGRYSIAQPTPGHFQFHRPDGTPLQNEPLTVAPGDDALRRANTTYGVEPTHETTIPEWDGQHPDYPLIIDLLLNTDQHPHPDNN